MNEIPNIITERVDDIPLLLEQMQRMGLPTLFDDHFPIHGNWQGLSLGWVSTIWLSAILSRGDHRLVHVEPWVAKRLWTLGTTTGQAVTRVGYPLKAGHLYDFKDLAPHGVSVSEAEARHQCGIKPSQRDPETPDRK